MKKSLVLAMAMALGVTASAYAANPFSDVPAGHWAYDSIAELADAGVIEGYGDTTFGGDKLMTRYEMAQIVARAMANGADVDALAAEFADELDSLGVRVARLEKKADNVTINGQIRARYIDQDNDANRHGYVADLRTRLWVNGQINDNWKYVGMLQNVQDFTDNGGDDDIDLKRAYLVGRVGGVDVTAGRYNTFIGDGFVYDETVDGGEISYGDKVNVTAFAGEQGIVDHAAIQVTTKLGVVDVMAGYANFDNSEGSEEIETVYLELATPVAKNLNLKGIYLKSYDDGHEEFKEYVDAVGDDGYAFELTYKGADKNDVGSFGLTANYWDQGGITYAVHTTDANTFENLGFEGYGVAVDYTLAKNMVGTVAYYDTESKVYDYEDQRLWTSVQFYF